VSFDYNVSGDIFNLGLSVVPGSENVYLNGKLLVRDTDYAIDYELGLLTLLTQVKESDTIRVDYERSRGGLGSGAEYARNFYGTMLTLPVSSALTLNLSLLQAADSVGGSVDKERTRTMPNTHTVSGVVGTINLDGFNARFTVGYNDNVFPFDDNLRLNMPNEITSILASGDYTLVASLNGLSVRHNGKWTAYSAASGLSGSRIYAMTSDDEYVYFGTSSGLSVLTLSGEAPFDQVENWERYYLEDGLPTWRSAPCCSMMARSTSGPKEVWLSYLLIRLMIRRATSRTRQIRSRQFTPWQYPAEIYTSEQRAACSRSMLAQAHSHLFPGLLRQRSTRLPLAVQICTSVQATDLP